MAVPDSDGDRAASSNARIVRALRIRTLTPAAMRISAVAAQRRGLVDGAGLLKHRMAPFA